MRRRKTQFHEIEKGKHREGQRVVILAEENGDCFLVKKCAQCSQLLPLKAFHLHKRTPSRRQSECRTCKGTINKFFNPLRTPDQFLESSLLTRERKILLRENETLKQFKEHHHKRGLRHFVWERFNHKCFKCGTNVTLRGYQLDHTRPLSYLWPLDQYATCLCETCNQSKNNWFPVDFYSEQELTGLSMITGMPLVQLREKSVNQMQLACIRADIVGFVNSWSSRLFQSIAKRVIELHPTINLFQELETASPDTYTRITTELAAQPS